MLSEEELKALEHLACEVENEELVAIMNVRIHDELYGRVSFRQRLWTSVCLGCLMIGVAAASVTVTESTQLTRTAVTLSAVACVITYFFASHFEKLMKVHLLARRSWVALQHELIRFKWRVQRLPVEDVEQAHRAFDKLVKERGNISLYEPVLNDRALIERCQTAAEIQTGRRPPPAKYEDLKLPKLARGEYRM